MAANTDNKELPVPSPVNQTIGCTEESVPDPPAVEDHTDDPLAVVGHTDESVPVLLEVDHTQGSSFTLMLNYATLSFYETDNDLSSVMHSAFLTLDGSVCVDTGNNTVDDTWDGVLQTSHQEQNTNANNDSVELLEANDAEGSQITALVTDQFCQNANCKDQPETRFMKLEAASSLLLHF